jgi:hypothetical protein
MGATTFFTYSHGRNVGEAFRQAQDEARYENGHGGYTGTIAEKPGAVTLDLPPRVTVHTFQSKIYGAENAICEIESKGDEYGYKATAKDRADLRWLIEHFGGEYQAKRIVRQYHDKWGECLAFELRGSERQNALMNLGLKKGTRQKVYAFLGWASC